MYLINSATGLPFMPSDALPVAAVGGALPVVPKPAASASNAGAVAVTDAETPMTTATTGCTEITFCNHGPDPVAIGAPGLMWAARVWVLEVGDVLTRTTGANLAWSAICDTAKTSSVTVEKVL